MGLVLISVISSQVKATIRDSAFRRIPGRSPQDSWTAGA